MHQLAEHRSKIIGATAISFSAILWGLDGVVLTPRLYNLNVAYVVFMLHMIPFAIMNAFLFRQYKYIHSFSASDYLLLFLVALFGGALGTLSVVKALFLVEFKKLTVVILLQKLQPVFAIALATIILKEKLKKYYLIWASVAIVASYFLTFGTRLPNIGTGSNTIYAALFSLLAALSFGSSTVLSKKILEKYSFHTVTFYRYGFTSALLLIYVLFTGLISQISVTTPLNWLFFMIIAITSGSGAIFLYYYGLKKVKAIIATICELFFPVSAIIFDYLFNDQFLTPVQWISAALLIFAIVNLNIRNTRKNPKKVVS
ncbi:MAG: EamA family transporter [Bacteroidales bacterium]